MTDQPMGDDVYQPDNEEQADAAALDLEDALDERDYDDILDEGYSPPEKPLGATRFGITAAEQHDGESLDERLAEELPDVGADEAWGIGDLSGGDGELIDSEVGATRAGRLVAPDEGAHGDDEKDMIAFDMGIDGGAASAEEAAMHVVSEEDLDLDY